MSKQDQVTNQGASRLNEAKILLVGQGGVGKTSIVKGLTSSTFDLAESKTEGIRIQPWKVNINDETYRLNIWDFGGQEIMHATHQFFLTERSIYILVIDSRLGERENGLEYWLKIIESYGGDSPIIVVGNKIDQHQLDIDKRGLKSKYKTIAAIIETSCKTRQGLKELENTIKQALSNLPHIHSIIPQTWSLIREQIEKSNESFINFSKFQNICTMEGVTDSEDQMILLSFLHDLGIVFHYKNDPRLEDTNILNPNWVTNGVYAILNSRLLAESKGILHVDQLHQILSEPEYPKDKHLFIVDIMRKFELCFELEGSKETQFLIPELLPKEEPTTKDLDGALSLEFHYNILPRSIISRFIVRMHPFIHNNVYWRNGVVLEYADNIAFVKADIEDRKIYLRVSGNEDSRRDFFSKLQFQIESIHKTVPRLEVKTKIPIPDHPNVLVDYEHLMNLADMGETTFIPEGLNQRVDIWKLLGGFRKDFYHKVKGINRLRYMDKLTLSAMILGIIAALISIVQFYPKLVSIIKIKFGIVKTSFIPIAFASSFDTGSVPDAAPVEAKTIINIIIICCILVAFFWTLAVSLHGDTNAKVKRASDLNKMLLGFLIGSAKSFFGL